MQVGQFITPDRRAELLSPARQPLTPWLRFDPEVLRTTYNRLPFLVSHRLGEHPLFALDSLFALCRRMPTEQVQHRFGTIPIDAHFDSSLSRFRDGLSLEDAIEHLEDRSAYICIYNPELDAQYKPVIEGLLAEVATQIEPLDSPVNWYSTYIFISARASVTPYHMDREMNFLLQVRGTKTVRLWDPADDGVMTQAQKEILFAADGSRPTYRPSLEAKAMIFDLKPGLGVHHPFIAPHLVHTGPDLSISLAITFRTRQSDAWSETYRFNHRLRSLGLHPGQVGEHPRIDRAKANLLQVVRRSRDALLPRY